MEFHLKLSDRVLILRCQAGDEAAFARLYAAFAEPTLRYLRGIVGPGAEDVHQEVWFQVFKRIRTLKDPGRFRTWLFQVTRNRAFDYVRQERREEDLVENHARDASTVGDAAAVDESTELEIDLASSLRQLRPAHREAIALRYWEGMSYAEIAQIVGVPVGTIRSRLYHAREALRAAAEPPSPLSATQGLPKETR